SDAEQDASLRPMRAAVGGREHDVRAVGGKTALVRILELFGEHVRDAVAVGADGAARRSEPALTVPARVGGLDLRRPPRVAAVAGRENRERRDLRSGVVVSPATELRVADVGAPEERAREGVVRPDLLLVREGRVALS